MKVIGLVMSYLFFYPFRPETKFFLIRLLVNFSRLLSSSTCELLEDHLFKQAQNFAYA